MPTPDPSGLVSRKFLPSLTSLRWFAATAVFLRHAGIGPNGFAQGATGVSFFFVLSGFVLAWSYRPGQGPRDFYVRRAARVYPAYALVAVLAVPVLMATDLVRGTGDIGRAFFTLTLLQSWVPSESVYFGGTGVAWSLADEAFFYLLFPLVASALLRVAAVNRNGRLVAALGTLVVVGLAVPVLLHPAKESGLAFWAIYINPGFRLVEFVIGMCLALLQQRSLLPRIPLGPTITLTLAAFAVAGIVPLWAMWSAVTLIPFGLLIVAAAQADEADATPRLLHHPLLLRLGAWSYAFYLVHTVGLAAARSLAERLDLGVSPVLVALLTYVAATAAAALLHEAFERPVERWAKRRLTREPAGGST